MPCRGGPGKWACTRREILMVGGVGLRHLPALVFSCGRAPKRQDETADFVERQMGRPATESERLHLTMPAVFPTGYTVPMDLKVDSPMTEDDYVKRIRVFAPENPLIDVASFNFVPAAQRGPRVDSHPSRQTAIRRRRRRNEWRRAADGQGMGRRRHQWLHLTARKGG